MGLLKICCVVYVVGFFVRISSFELWVFVLVRILLWLVKYLLSVFD